MMGKVLFVSQNPFGRCENLMAVWNAYDGEKEFRHGVVSMGNAENEGFSVVVCDCLPAYIHHKRRCKTVNICHGITGNKTYGADEKWRPWFNEAAAKQTDYAIAASEKSIPIVARQLSITEDCVVPLGMPRTDAYFAEAPKVKEFDGKTVYLYTPTFRYENDGFLPEIDWSLVDDLLTDDELFVVKRHYFTKEELTQGYDISHGRVIELSPDEPALDYIRSCDVMLTDYSSIMFDAYLAKKPCVLTVDDMKDFLLERGMYYSYPISYSSRWLHVEGNEHALIAMMREAAKNGLGIVEREIINTVAGACDGHSTKRVCELIKSLL